MANSPQALKRARQNDTRRDHKASQKSFLRTEIKKVRKACASDIAHDTAAQKTLFSQTQSSIDKAAKNIIHPNKAARIKSRLNKALKAASSAPQTAVETPAKKKRSKSSKA
jgi:small subunit ribosomal protein S20